MALDLIWETELVPLELDPILLAWKAGPKVDWPQRKIEAREKERNRKKRKRKKVGPSKTPMLVYDPQQILFKEVWLLKESTFPAFWVKKKYYTFVFEGTFTEARNVEMHCKLCPKETY